MPKHRKTKRRKILCLLSSKSYFCLRICPNFRLFGAGVLHWRRCPDTLAQRLFCIRGICCSLLWESGCEVDSFSVTFRGDVIIKQEVTNLANFVHTLQALKSSNSQNVSSLRRCLIEEASNFSAGVCNAAVTGRICYWLSLSCKIFLQL